VQPSPLPCYGFFKVFQKPNLPRSEDRFLPALIHPFTVASGLCVESGAGCKSSFSKRAPRLTLQCFAELFSGLPLDSECCVYDSSGNRLSAATPSEINAIYHSQDLAAYARVICGTSAAPTGPLLDIPQAGTGGSTGSGGSTSCSCSAQICQNLSPPLCLACCAQGLIGSGISPAVRPLQGAPAKCAACVIATKEREGQGSPAPGVATTRPVVATTAPTTTSKAANGSPGAAGGTNSSSGGACIGYGTQLNGKSIRAAVQENMLYIMKHPLGDTRGMAPVLRATLKGDRLCATKNHIVRPTGGSPLRMDALCSTMVCEAKVQNVFNVLHRDREYEICGSGACVTQRVDNMIHRALGFAENVAGRKYRTVWRLLRLAHV
jgi:hypothetical protein